MGNIYFEKVSEKQFIEDYRKCFGNAYTDEELKKIYANIKLPKRGSSGAAGYDFYSTINFLLDNKNNVVTIPTGIRAVMPNDLYLQIVPRSSVGFKTGTSLVNSVAIIDADYQMSPNEGHIMLKFRHGFKDLLIEEGDRIAQGIFLKYFITDNDDIKVVRLGGLGSTGV